MFPLPSLGVGQTPHPWTPNPSLNANGSRRERNAAPMAAHRLINVKCCVKKYIALSVIVVLTESSAARRINSNLRFNYWRLAKQKRDIIAHTHTNTDAGGRAL